MKWIEETSLWNAPEPGAAPTNLGGFPTEPAPRFMVVDRETGETQSLTAHLQMLLIAQLLTGQRRNGRYLARQLFRPD